MNDENPTTEELLARIADLEALLQDNICPICSAEQ